MKIEKTFVKSKFDKIVRRYDLVNLVGSFGRDKYWRKRVAELLDGCEPPILDLCCGPFTLTLELSRRHRVKFWALDFSFQMLHYVRSRIVDKPIAPVCGDAEQLPFKSETFGAITIAFGFRNLPNREKALSEFFRVLKPRGRLIILEFSWPKNFLFQRIYKLYLDLYMPFLGGLLTGDKQAYEYLADSIKAFPPPEKVKSMLEKEGFREVFYTPLTMGIVYIYKAVKP